ncbi:DUF3347 domain-containing protein [Zunongwangia sp. H14]|uniref:DUF3347 domain-containing protein n=1 Tax=Zunongwangia sp. H14 TaxID=3240792 RepID=UPI00356A5852
MKNVLIVSIAIMLFFLSVSCKEKTTVEVNTPEEVKKEEKKTPDVADQDFIDGMTGKIWHNYLEIKMALTNADVSQAKKISNSMASSFSEEKSEMKSIAEKIAETNDIEKQRELFDQFTEKVGPMFEDALSGGTIYKKFCPMAFNNKGAYWYADIAEISNPYFGDKMPNCGSVKKTISK